MKDISLNTFIQELSSLSPLTDTYEANIVVLLSYIALLKKNTSLSLIRTSNADLEKFLVFLDEKIDYIDKMYDSSANYIKNYMSLVKSGNIKQIQDISTSKIKSYIDIVYIILDIVDKYNICQNCYKQEHILSNSLCISSIINIKSYLIEFSNSMLNEIDDENMIFLFMDKLNKAI